MIGYYVAVLRRAFERVHTDFGWGKRSLVTVASLTVLSGASGVFWHWFREGGYSAAEYATVLISSCYGILSTAGIYFLWSVLPAPFEIDRELRNQVERLNTEINHLKSSLEGKRLEAQIVRQFENLYDEGQKLRHHDLGRLFGWDDRVQTLLEEHLPNEAFGFRSIASRPSLNTINPGMSGNRFISAKLDKLRRIIMRVSQDLRSTETDEPRI